jgi:hypothetical protein
MQVRGKMGKVRIISMRNILKMKINFSIFLLLLITLVGCSPKNYQDMSALISSLPLPVPEGEYSF